MAITLLGLLLCALHISQSLPSDFAIDLDLHVEYLRFVAEYGRLPQAGDVIAFYHMPAYYFLAAQPYALAESLGFDPVQAARWVAFVCYGAYVVMAGLLLRRLLYAPSPSLQGASAASDGGVASHPSIFYLLFAMLICLPVGVVHSGRIHPEVLAYMGHMGLLYCLIRWVMDRDISLLANAFVFAGIFMLARNFAVFFVLLLLGFFIHALWRNRHHWREMMGRRMWLSIAFCAVCYGFVAWYRDITPNLTPTVVRGPLTWQEVFTTFIYFNPWIYISETVMSPSFGRNLDHHWHYFIRTSVLGNFADWKAWPVAFATGVVWLGVVVYTLWGALTQPWKQLSAAEKRGFGLIVFLMVMMAGMSMGARFFHMHMPGISDARYIFPITALFIACFGRVIIGYQLAGRPAAASIGKGLALGMVLLSVALFVGEHVVL